MDDVSVEQVSAGSEPAVTQQAQSTVPVTIEDRLAKLEAQSTVPVTIEDRLAKLEATIAELLRESANAGRIASLEQDKQDLTTLLDKHGIRATE